ncbi:MAG TPA: MFS transporter [Symbiobacteriaceae bacterium]|nr:MFS transporter [Symbiobacteriaceae bacterium]
MAAIAENQVPVAGPGLFRNRAFMALFVGQTISIIGDGFHSVALGLWVLQTTGSATAMATIMSVQMAANVLLGTLAGAIVDRVDRYRAMMLINAVRFLLSGAIAYLIFSGVTTLLPLVILSGLLSVAGNFYGPALQASLIIIVGKENVPKAVSLRQVTNTLAGVAGPLLGGTVVALAGGATAMTVDAFTFLFAGIMTLLGGYFPSPARSGEATRSIWHDMAEGIGYIRHNPLITSVVGLAPLLNFFGMASFLLLPVIAVRIWHASPTQFGALEASVPLGLAIGAAVLMAVSKKLTRRGWWMIGAMFCNGLTMSLVPFMPSVVSALPILAVGGIFNAVVNVLLTIVIQTETPADMQGRVFGTLNAVFSVANPMAMMLAGVLADRFSPVLLAAGAGLAVVLLSATVMPAAKALRNYN